MTTTVTIHHLAFDCPESRFHFSSKDYGRMELVVEGSTITELADDAFRTTNHPDMEPDVVSKAGFCPTLSVGDVVEIPEGLFSSPLRFAVVNHLGFTPITKSEFEQLLEEHRKYFEEGKQFNLADHLNSGEAVLA